MKAAIIITVLTLTACLAMAQESRLLNTRHNLSASGPGTVRASIEQEVCIFCHTPHNATPVQPLWNRYLPVSAYRVYSSNSLDALPGQPTSTSKLCLSCHDGTIALGSVVSRDQTILMAGGITTMPAGATNLGTDLSDDHPISFRFDSSLLQRDPKLRDPSLLPESIKLDGNRELQCTSCHDAHDNSFGKFLVMRNESSQLCNACHRPGTTQVVGHQDCQSCHKVHTAPSGPLLLARHNVRESCIACHDAIGGPDGRAPNIAQHMSKLNVHDTDSQVDLADAISNHVGCTDCHQPHTMNKGTATAPTIHPNFGQIHGINTAGGTVGRANFEYEVCFKCHGDNSAVQPWISRQIVQNNTRLEFNQTAISFHPVTSAGKSSNVPSLKPGMTTSDMIYCSDCHRSDPAIGVEGGKGAHGSNNEPLLVARYDTTDNTRESSNAFALCYSCHERSSILDDESFDEHKKHIVGENTPCSACHDAHGIASAQGTMTRNSHLINFDTTIVRPNRRGRLEFIDQGQFRGNCSLLCHGEDHDMEDYKP